MSEGEKFCKYCGTPTNVNIANKNELTVNDTQNDEIRQYMTEVAEKSAGFAFELPEWSVYPPKILVKRKKIIK